LGVALNEGGGSVQGDDGFSGACRSCDAGRTGEGLRNDASLRGVKKYRPLVPWFLPAQSIK
jgi:hypothetical protein